MELEPGIHQMTFGKEPLPGFHAPNSYLVFGTDTSILIDTGWENNDDHRSRMAYLRQTNSPPISEIIITSLPFGNSSIEVALRNLPKDFNL